MNIAFILLYFSKKSSNKGMKVLKEGVILWYLSFPNPKESQIKTNSKDKALISELPISELGINQVTLEISNNYRLGRYDATKSRPVLVTVTNEWTKRTIFAILYKMKQVSEKFKKVCFEHDLTKEERSLKKQMWQEAKQKEEESGEKWRVSYVNSELMLVKKRPSPNLATF